MALLGEYALTPDVFDASSYSSGEVGQIHLQYLKEVLLNEGLVRNLRSGAWLSLFDGTQRPWHLRGKELLKKLATQNRLRPWPEMTPSDPTSDHGWCLEAVASHHTAPLSGVIATGSIAECFTGESVVASIDKLPITQWWTGRSSSVRLNRKESEYEHNLRLIMQCANSIMFVDPHLDPSLDQYQEFFSLLRIAGSRRPLPLIQIHRVCYRGSGPARIILSKAELESRFQGAWGAALESIGLALEVCVWDDFHDRYLISDLIGISVPYGFDTATNLDSVTTWTRLSRKDRDDIQREFDEASKRHKLRYRFQIP